MFELSGAAKFSTPPRVLLFAMKSRELRSEEHTSELQSQSNLVCRLLLEKKKINSAHIMPTRAATLLLSGPRAVLAITTCLSASLSGSAMTWPDYRLSLTLLARAL